MKLTGSYDIPVDKKTVWDALNNPRNIDWFVICIDKFD